MLTTSLSRLLSALFSESEIEVEETAWHAPLDDAWPTLPPSQTPTLSTPSIFSQSNPSEGLSLNLCKSRSFSDEIYHELGKNTSQSSEFTFEHTSRGDSADASNDNVFFDLIYRSNSSPQFVSIEDQEAGDHQNVDRNDDSEISQDALCAIQPNVLGGSQEYALTPTTAIHRSATLHKVTRAASSATDINMINELNEQDPAFVRATEALRASGSSSKVSDIVGSKSALESADCSPKILTRPRLLSSLSVVGSGFKSLRRRPTA
jgi:hypothetical protein